MRDLLAALRLQWEWGADEALASEPVQRLGSTSSAVLPVPARPVPGRPVPADPEPVHPVATFARPADDTPAARAEAVAAAATTISDWRAAIESFEGCALRATATSTVFPEGNPESGLVLVSEAPGPEEDRSGRPLAGPAGQYLDRMLGSVGLDRAAMLAIPLLPWRPPGGRPPTDGEIAICLPFLLRYLALIRPRRAVLLGQMPVRTLLGASLARGRRPRITWVDMPLPDGAMLPAVPMPNPAIATRQASARREAWEALRLLRRAIDRDHLAGT